MNKVNKVELQGRIVGIFEGRRRTIVTLFVSGYSKNFPQIVFTGTDRDKLEEYNEGDFVNIEGTIKTRSIIREDKRYYSQFIKGLEIRPAVSSLSKEFGEGVGGRCEYVNKIVLSGTVVSTSDVHGVPHIILKTPEDKFTIWLTDFSVTTDAVTDEYPKGTEVYVSAEVQTVRKEKDGEVKYFENLIVQDIVKC